MTHNYIPKPAPVKSKLHHFRHRTGSFFCAAADTVSIRATEPETRVDSKQKPGQTPFRNRQTIKPARYEERSPLAAEGWISGHLSGYRASLCVVRHATKR